MSEFQQSLFDVDNTMNSVFDDAQDLASQFEYTTEADEDDRMMGIVLSEDGTELPKFDELHNNEKSDLGDDNDSFADGIFGDETDNAPKCDPATNGSQLDKDNGPEGSHTYFDGSCPENGVQDAGKSSDDGKDAADLKTSTKKASEVMSDERAKEIANKDLATEAWLDTMYEDYAEGTKAPMDIDGGIQDHGDTYPVIDDDDVENMEDSMADSESATCDEIASMGVPTGKFEEDDDLGLDIPTTLGLDVPEVGEGQVKDANSVFQDDLDESFLMEEDDEEVTSYDSGDDEDDDVEDDSDYEDDDYEADDDVDDAVDDSEDDEIDEAYFFESDDKGQPMSYKTSLDLDNDDDDEGEQKPTSDQVKQMKDNEKSTNEAYLFEEDEIEDELNGVIDDEDMRHGEGNAVKCKEGECAFADDLEESFFMEENTDPEVVDNVNADTDTDEIEDDSEVEDLEDDSDKDVPDLSYSEDDDEIFDSVNED